MPDEKKQIDVKKVFLGVMFLLGGCICILMSVMIAHFFVNIILGITLVMLGTAFIWQATEGFRKKRRQRETHV